MKLIELIKNHLCKILIVIAILGSGYIVALYYQNEIKDMQLEAERAKSAAVERAIEQHNQVTQLDQAVMRSYINSLEEQDRHYENLLEEVSHVEKIDGCYISPGLVRLWNQSHRRRDENADSPGTNSLYDIVPADARLSALDLRLSAGVQGGDPEPHQKRGPVRDLRQ